MTSSEETEKRKKLWDLYWNDPMAKDLPLKERRVLVARNVHLALEREKEKGEK